MKHSILLTGILAMFSLIQLPNLQWIPKALPLSQSSQRPSPSQLARDTVQERVRYFIPIRHAILFINVNSKRFKLYPLRVFEMLSQSCYLGLTSPTIERRTIVIFMIYAFRSASSRGTPSTKSMENLQSRSTFLPVLLSPLQHTDILNVDRPNCSSPFTLRFSHG